MSLVGAVAHLAHTRVDVLVFISALQRHNCKPQIVRVKRLNKLLRWIQAHPKKLTYKALSSGSLPTEATKNLRIIAKVHCL